MESLYYNLSEREFSKGRKLLLWIFASLFFLAGLWILFSNIVLGNKTIQINLSIAPLGISLFVSIVAIMATLKRKDNYFSIDDEKIAFRYGMFKPVKQSFNWRDIKDVCLPRKQKKVKLIFNDNSSYIINLIWLEKKKSGIIRKHIFYGAKEKNINIVKVQIL